MDDVINAARAVIAEVEDLGDDATEAMSTLVTNMEGSITILEAGGGALADVDAAAALAADTAELAGLLAAAA
jgi:hypothetical protein